MATVLSVAIGSVKVSEDVRFPPHNRIQADGVEAQRFEDSKFQRDHPDGVRYADPGRDAVAGYQSGSIPAPIAPPVQYGSVPQGYNVLYPSYTTSNLSTDPFGSSQQMPGFQGSGQVNPYPYTSGDLAAGIGRLNVNERQPPKQISAADFRLLYRGEY
jgi:hypothetical protein